MQPFTRDARLDGAWWSRETADLLAALGSSAQGLGAADAAQRLAATGSNAVADSGCASTARLLWRQFSSPLVLILVIASVLSLLLRDWVDAATILAIVAGSSLSAAGVLVRRLDAIEDPGGIDVLCTDKTGTLTVGTMALTAAADADGRASPQVLRRRT
jgi:magnesium-transporting ATPase (P-type)